MKKQARLPFCELPIIKDDARLCIIEGKKNVPFPIKRVYFIRDCLSGLERGHHAHKKNKQALFCIQGKVDILIDDGREKKIIKLKSPNQGVFLDCGIWHVMKHIRKNTILLVVASEYFDENDYLRDYQAFLKFKRIQP